MKLQDKEKKENVYYKCRKGKCDELKRKRRKHLG